MKLKTKSEPSENVIQKAMRFAKQEERPFKVVLKRLIDNGEGPKSTGQSMIELVKRMNLPETEIDLPEDLTGVYFDYLTNKQKV